MKDVILLRRGKETKKTGVGVYSDMLEMILDDVQLNHESIEFKLTTDEGYLKCLRQGFIEPLFKVISSKSQIYHATEELSCLYFPFIKGKKVVTFHHVSESREGTSRLLYPIWKISARLAISHSDAIIAISHQTKEDIIRTFGVKESKVHVITHGPDSLFRNLGKTREKMIGFVGTLIERKNVVGGLRAFKLFTELPGTEGYRFVICGNGPMKEDLRTLATELGISERVEFISDLTKEDLVEFYNRMAVFANSSMLEGLGMTALEAQACGTPVVFFKDARIPKEVSEHFIPSDDEQDFAANMHRLISDEAYKESTKNTAKGASLSGYSDKLIKVYSDLIGKDLFQKSR